MIESIPKTIGYTEKYKYHNQRIIVYTKRYMVFLKIFYILISLA